jgi:hypothetical protein
MSGDDLTGQRAADQDHHERTSQKRRELETEKPVKVAAAPLRSTATL